MEVRRDRGKVAGGGTAHIPLSRRSVASHRRASGRPIPRQRAVRGGRGAAVTGVTEERASQSTWQAWPPVMGTVRSNSAARRWLPVPALPAGESAVFRRAAAPCRCSRRGAAPGRCLDSCAGGSGGLRGSQPSISSAARSATHACGVRRRRQRPAVSRSGRPAGD